MARAPREPRIAAHLGRPETPAEEAARKAENSKNYRQSQSFRNLIIALVASLAIVAVVYFIVPRGEVAERPAARRRRHRAPGRRPVRAHRDRARRRPKTRSQDLGPGRPGQPLGLVGELQRHSRSAARAFVQASSRRSTPMRCGRLRCCAAPRPRAPRRSTASSGPSSTIRDPDSHRQRLLRARHPGGIRLRARLRQRRTRRRRTSLASSVADDVEQLKKESA